MFKVECTLNISISEFLYFQNNNDFTFQKLHYVRLYSNTQQKPKWQRRMYRLLLYKINSEQQKETGKANKMITGRKKLPVFYKSQRSPISIFLDFSLDIILDLQVYYCLLYVNLVRKYKKTSKDIHFWDLRRRDRLIIYIERLILVSFD